MSGFAPWERTQLEEDFSLSSSLPISTFFFFFYYIPCFNKENMAGGKVTIATFAPWTPSFHLFLPAPSGALTGLHSQGNHWP